MRASACTGERGEATASIVEHNPEAAARRHPGGAAGQSSRFRSRSSRRSAIWVAGGQDALGTGAHRYDEAAATWDHATNGAWTRRSVMSPATVAAGDSLLVQV